MIADNYDDIATRQRDLDSQWIADPGVKLAEAWLLRITETTLAQNGVPSYPAPWPEDMPRDERQRRAEAAAEDLLNRLKAIGAPVLNPKITWDANGSFMPGFHTLGLWRRDLV